ncbi:hypothetical protein ACFLQI_00895 [Candidatus Undinarchaeota archaeon]
MKIDSGEKMGLTILIISAAIITYASFGSVGLSSEGMFTASRGASESYCGNAACEIGENSNICIDCDLGYAFYGHLSTTGSCEPLLDEYTVCLSEVVKDQDGLGDMAVIYLSGQKVFERMLFFEGSKKSFGKFEIQVIDIIPGNDDGSYVLISVNSKR